MSCDLTVVVLAFNEEKHLRRCIESVKGIASRIVVVDSNSSDSTPIIAHELNAVILNNKWVNHATQFNWALDQSEVVTGWTMRLDADEVVTPELANEIKNRLSMIPESVAGLTVNRQIHFLGKWIRYGGIYPTPMLRIFRTGHGRCENRWMDEHIVVDGEVGHLAGDIADINLNNLTWWTNKHNHYANREVVDLLLARREGHTGTEQAGMSRQARVKRWLKERVYARLPLGLRALSYFFLRYFVMFGFLDGWRGLAFHALQGLWYRFLVDLKVYEIEQLMQQRGQSLEEVVYAEFGYEIGVQAQ